MTENLILSVEKFLKSDNPLYETISFDSCYIHNIPKIRIGKIKCLLSPYDKDDVMKFNSIQMTKIYSKVCDYLRFKSVNDNININKIISNKICNYIYDDNFDMMFFPYPNYYKTRDLNYDIFEYVKNIKLKIIKPNDYERVKGSVAYVNYFGNNYYNGSCKMTRRKNKLLFKNTSGKLFPITRSYITIDSSNYVAMEFEIFFKYPNYNRVSHACKSLHYNIHDNLTINKSNKISDFDYNYPIFVDLSYSNQNKKRKSILKMNILSLEEWELEYFSNKTYYTLTLNEIMLKEVKNEMENYGDYVIEEIEDTYDSDKSDIISMSKLYNFTDIVEELDSTFLKTELKSYRLIVNSNIKAVEFENIIKKCLDKLGLVEDPSCFYSFEKYGIRDITKYTNDDIKAYLIHVLFHCSPFTNKRANNISNKIFSMMTKDQIERMNRFYKLNNFIL